MNIITVDEEVWKHLNERLKAISEYILKLEDTSYDSLWLNNHEVCQYLHISEKTLMAYAHQRADSLFKNVRAVLLYHWCYKRYMPMLTPCRPPMNM